VSFPTKGGDVTEYWHAEADKASEIIGDELRKEGIIHTWRPSEGANGRCIMTCVFRHSSGHVEDMATIGGPPESSGTKNSLQAIGSTITYLQRYSLLAAAGIVPKGMDNDGMTTAEGMPEDAITDYRIAMQDAADFPLLKPIFAECYKKARDLGDKEAAKRLQKVYEERKKELWAAKKEAAR
jgi:ERF superfamily